MLPTKKPTGRKSWQAKSDENECWRKRSCGAIVFATAHQSSQSSVKSTSQEVSRNPTEQAPAKAAPASVPREPSPVLDLSRRPRKMIIPEFVPVTGKEFFFKDSALLHA